MPRSPFRLATASTLCKTVIYWRFEDRDTCELQLLQRQLSFFSCLFESVRRAGHRGRYVMVALVESSLTTKKGWPYASPDKGESDAKKWYIFHDTKREALKLGIPYGFVADPLGPGVAGLAKGKSLLTNQSWRSWAEDNRKAIYDCGRWGVPSFRYGAVSCWGQDRLWVIGRRQLT